MPDQKISNQVLTGSNTAATAADNSQVALSHLSAATVGAAGSRMTFLAAAELPAATAPMAGEPPYPTFLPQQAPSHDFDYPAFGYTGHFHKGTQVAFVDWDGNHTFDEAFGIAPDRTIWHAWNNSNGWHEMFNGSKPAYADSIRDALTDLNGRVIAVNVTTGVSSPQVWASENSHGTWGTWYRLS